MNAVVQSDDPMMGMIERAARDSAVDIDKLERLFALQERMLAQNRKTAYNAAMAVVQAKIKPVYRDAMNKITNSPYATLEAVSDAITPIYTAEGFSLSFDTDDCPIAGHIRIMCEVMHSAGHSATKHFDLALDDVGLKGNANKTPIQASGSTISYGRRYLKLMVFDVVLTNEDNDGNRTEETIGPGQLAAIEQLIAEVKADVPKLCRMLKVETLSDIRVGAFETVKAIIEAKRGK